MNPVRYRRAAGSLAVCVAFLLLVAQGPPASASAGSFAPPHADAGVETNGDHLFNYLRIDASLQVTTPGMFTIKVVLNDDLDLGKLTEASVTVSLAGGAQTVSVFLDGPDIYNGGVDGPYHAHLTLQSEYGETLAMDVHTTAAYGFADFQPYVAHFVPPNSEKTWDNDTDGLKDWIDLGFTLDVATAGRYTLSSLLTDSTYTVSVRWSQTRDLAAGRATLHQLFLGYPIRLSQRNGPYMVTNTLSDGRGQFIDFLYVQTASYDYTVFETPPARLNPPHSDTGVDLDGDGLYNTLRVDVGLSIDASGTYSVRGQLYSGGGQFITSTVSTLVLSPGTVKVSLSFLGYLIYDSGFDGPYRVDLDIFDTGQLRLDFGSYWTASYSRFKFQPRLAYLDPPHEDQGIDVNGNGKYEVLRLFVHLNVTAPVILRIDAALRQGVLSSDLVRASVNASLSPGLRVVSLDFAAADIIAAGKDGPYRAWISLYGPNNTLLDEGSHRTQGYLLSDFDPGPRGEIVGLYGDRPEDLDLDGLYNRLRLTVAVNVSEAGRYRLEGALVKNSVTIAQDSTAQELGPGAAMMVLVFGGPDIRAAGLDGPYDVQVALRGSRGALLASAVLTTAAYPATSFRLAASVTLSGLVSSAVNGTSMDGATVWIVDYDDHVSRTALADAAGRYSLRTYTGTYWIVVDHPNGQAKVSRQTLTADTWLNASLYLPNRLAVRDTITWAGWNDILVSVRYTYATDASAIRLELDWMQGNRDGWVESSEATLIQDPVDRLRDVIDAGSSMDRLLVNGENYSAAGDALWDDAVSGNVSLGEAPAREVVRAFRTGWKIGKPPRAEIAFDTYYDSASVDRILLFYVPGFYRFASSNATEDVVVRFRKGVNPILLDPLVVGSGAEPPDVGFIRIMLYTQASYVPPTPSAPTGLSATLEGGTDVALSWLAPTTNTDGSRILNLAGYHVYRASSSGPLTRIGSLLPWTSASDRPGSGTYSYAVSAVNTDGVESALSSPVTITVGAPSASNSTGLAQERGARTLPAEGEPLRLGVPLSPLLGFSACISAFLAAMAAVAAMTWGARIPTPRRRWHRLPQRSANPRGRKGGSIELNETCEISLRNESVRERTSSRRR